MQPIIQLLKLPNQAFNVLKELLKLLSTPEKQLPRQFQNNPDALLNYLRDIIAPLQSALVDVTPAPEQSIRKGVYKSLAKLLEKELRIHPDDAYNWLLFKAEPDHPLDRATRERAQDVDHKLSAHKIVLQCKYTNDGRKKYCRIDTAYITDNQNKQPIRAIEAKRTVSLDDLPRAVHHAFLMNQEPEFSFIIL